MGCYSSVMFEEIIQVTGNTSGPTSIILAGVHGDEKCGVEALQNIIPNLEIESGMVFFAYGNPLAIAKNVRYTESNLNRMFSVNAQSSYEYQRAQFLKTYLDKADVLLDLHASSIPGSKVFAICEPNAAGIVDYLPTDLVVIGFDAIEPGATDGYMNNNGKIGICLECGYYKDPKSTNLAEQAIFNFLKARGHITGDVRSVKQSYVRMFKKYYATTDNFKLAKSFENFEVVESGQLIGTDGQIEITADNRCLILFANDGRYVGEEVFLLGEQKNSLV